MKKKLQITIDGPVASGKGTAAKILASRLGILYIDTGAMYRAAAWIAKQKNVKWSDEDKIAKLVKSVDIQQRVPKKDEGDGRICTLLVNGEDVSWEIRTEEMSKGSSMVAVHAKVREVLVEKQQEIARKKSVVMEGRDITFKVLPKANLKIYLTASVKERARRRHKELLTRGIEVDLKEMVEEIKKRDERDMERGVDPLHIVDGAWVLDTTKLTIPETVDKIEKRLKKLKYV